MTIERRALLRGAAGLAGVMAAGCRAAPAPAITVGQQPVRTDEDVDRLLPLISNWGRWGPADRLGTLNLIGPAQRRRAAALVRSGAAVSLARLGNLAEAERGALEVTRRPRGSREFIAMVFHGFALTHLDGLAHAFTEDGTQLYNGVSSSAVTAAGAGEHGIEELAASGIAGRGVLLDVARLRGASLGPGDAIGASELEAAERSQGVRVEPGDLLFVRTGAGRRNTREGRSGLHPECLAWLRRRDVALLGGDGDSDAAPLAGFVRWASAMHAAAIPYLGLPLLDNADLEALAETCVREGRWEFLAVVSPLRLLGLTGSPVSPLALF